MKQTIVLTTIFLGAVLIGGGIYRVLMPCEGPPIPDCARVTLSNFKRDGGATFEVLPQPGQNEMAFQVNSNIMCPFKAHVDAELDRETLPNWTLGEIIRPAYVPHKTIEIVNGEGYVRFTPEDSPALSILPPGQYLAQAQFAAFGAESPQTTFFMEQFGITSSADLRDETLFRYDTTLGSLDNYKEYLSTWLRMVFKARQEGVTAQNLKAFERELGKAQASKKDGVTVYTFPATRHSIIVNEKGKVLDARRYSFEENGGQ